MTTATQTVDDMPWLSDALTVIADLPGTTPWPVAERILRTREIGSRATYWSRWHYDPTECTICGTTTAAGTQVHYTPGVCTCSETIRPTMADPCREENAAMICDPCSEAAQPVIPPKSRTRAGFAGRNPRRARCQCGCGRRVAQLGDTIAAWHIADPDA